MKWKPKLSFTVLYCKYLLYSKLPLHLSDRRVIFSCEQMKGKIHVLIMVMTLRIQAKVGRLHRIDSKLRANS
jgi:hypothetical protein